MSRTRKRTAVVVGSVTVLLLIWEFIGVFAPGVADMISPMIWDATFSMPLIPLAFGTLMGHWFWPKGACVHCGLRPWSKDASDGDFTIKLEAYFQKRMTGVSAGTAKMSVFGE